MQYNSKTVKILFSSKVAEKKVILRLILIYQIIRNG